ncbi:MAG: polysaccharide ABC transporter ATP-binding protein [Thermoanaerobaculia bacterium]
MTTASPAAISIRSLGKRYTIGELWQPRQVREILASPSQWFRRSPDRAEIWALRDVDLDIPSGEVVGIVGRNGAGKSTLLKILSRITAPTEGEARVYGRIASLLEVGTGFHPELTGRENVFLNGSILGMSRAEIRRKFDEIVAFAEIDRLLDTPVKRYSSGMFVRLAFAVAAHVEPEVLLVDEVLAVGDAAFQKKCLGRMQTIGREGRTVVMVSHNMSVVSNLCERVAWIDRGRVERYGDPHSTIGAYLSAGVSGELVWRPDRAASAAFAYHEVRVHCEGAEGDAFPWDASIDVVFDFTVTDTLPPAHIAMMLLADDGDVVLSSASSDATAALNQPFARGRWRFRCTIPGSLLHPGRYFLTFNEPGADQWVSHDAALNFTISEQNSIAARDGRTARVVPVLPWVVEQV